MKPEIGDYVTERDGLFLVKVMAAGDHVLCIGHDSTGRHVAVVGPVVVEDPADFLTFHQLRLQIHNILTTNIWPDVADELKKRMEV